MLRCYLRLTEYAKNLWVRANLVRKPGVKSLAGGDLHQSENLSK
jgi:hypothetical protein